MNISIKVGFRFIQVSLYRDSTFLLFYQGSRNNFAHQESVNGDGQGVNF